jgi:undecaprenol kinase
VGKARRDPKGPQYIGSRGFRSRSLWESFRHAWDGLRYIYISQRNMRIHVFLASLVFAAGLGAGLGRIELFMIALVVLGVLSAEVVNTLTESLVDLMKPEYSVVAKLIKDVAAAGVLLTAVFSVIIGAIVFYPVLADLPGVLEQFLTHRWRFFLVHLVVFVLPSLWGVLHFAGSDGSKGTRSDIRDTGPGAAGTGSGRGDTGSGLACASPYGTDAGPGGPDTSSSGTDTEVCRADTASRRAGMGSDLPGVSPWERDLEYGTSSQEEK